MSRPTLEVADLFAPHALGEIQRDYLGKSPVVMPPRPEIAEAASLALGVHSVDDVFRLRARIYAWFRKLDGQQDAAVLSSEAARAAYESGTTLYIQEAREFAHHEEAIAMALGLAPSAVKCSLFAHHSGAATGAHFDPVDLIVVQLSGQKTWRIAPNTFAPNPLQKWWPGTEPGPELRIYAPEAPPTGLPDNAEELLLEPGAVLYLPRGYWHETSSDRTSLSLHIQLVPSTWADVMLAALRVELIKDERWRKAAYALGAQDEGSRARAEAAERCRDLAKVASRLDPRDIAPPLPSENCDPSTTQFERCGQTFFAESGAEASKGMVSASVTSHRRPLTTVRRLEVPVGTVKAWHWVNRLGIGSVFTESDLQPSLANSARHMSGDLVRGLQDSGLIRVAATEKRTWNSRQRDWYVPPGTRNRKERLDV